ncbi:MAG: phosphoribosyltransferase [Candidatus Lustribacter sp.]
MNPTQIFVDRYDAGRRLAQLLLRYAGRRDVIVLALPRGGVPVAYEIAQHLHLPLDVFTVRKIGLPFHEEFAMGAIGSGGACVFNYDVIDALHVSHTSVAQAVVRERRELDRRERAYRDDRPFPQLADKTLIVVDDGIATGASMHVAITALRERNPARIIVAAPVGSEDGCTLVRRYADELVCAVIPHAFGSVAQYYSHFEQLDDESVRSLLGTRALAS